MVVTRTRRLINPTRKRRKLSPKQVKHFGTARQRAALKASRTRKRHATVAHRPKRRRASNPATLLTIGALNPHQQPKGDVQWQKRSAAALHERGRSIPSGVGAE